MDTVLVTGAAGFIGAEVTKLLLSQNKKVIGVDNLNDYYSVSLKKYRLQILENQNFDFHRIDIENYRELETIFAQNKIDAVINLAARAGVRYSMENPFIYMNTNANGTLNILELMREYSIKKMVLASTSSLYAGQKMPFDESLSVNTPISPYAASKKAAEVMAYSYHYLYNLDISIVRYFTVYGPAGRPDMSIFRFIKWIDEGKPIELFGDGNQSRDFTYVTDIARGTVLASQKNLGYEIINLGGGQNPISLLTIISTLENLLGKKAIFDQKPFHKADILETWASISKADQLLGWKPTIEIDTGLKNCVQWYQQNLDLCKSISL